MPLAPLSSLSPCSALARACPRPRPDNAAPPGPTGDQFQPGSMGPNPMELFHRLAGIAKAAARATTDSDTQGMRAGIGDILSRTLGVNVAQVQLDELASDDLHREATLTHHHGDDASVSTDAAAVTLDDLHLAAEGTLTTVDGQSFHFSLDYQRHVERAAAVSATSDNATAAPPDDTWATTLALAAYRHRWHRAFTAATDLPHVNATA